MGNGFNNSFNESFKTGMTIGGQGALETIKEKIKANEDARKSSATIDALRENIIKSAKTPDEALAFDKALDGLGKAKLSSAETLAIAKAIAPNSFKDQTGTNVFLVGNDGKMTPVGQAPSGSKIFKEALTPEEIGARTQASQDVKYSSDKETAARAFSLRQEFQAIPHVKDYQVIKAQVSSMDALMNKVKTGDGQSALALDQGLITLFNKITDPTSVVRESEYDRTPKNLSLANRFNGALQKLEKGGAGLTQEDREALVFGAKVIADSRAEMYNNTLSNYETLSTEFGVKPELVTSGFGKAEKFLKEIPTFKSVEELNAAKLPKGTRVMVGTQSGIVS